jgi:rare lipoprotein A
MSPRNSLRLFATAFFIILITPAAVADDAAVQPADASPSRATMFASKLLRAVGDVQSGLASFYHHSLHGLKTASGELYDQTAMTAAHPTLPIGTAIKVTNRHNRRSVIVRINDRGPNFGSRILDLSRAAAAELGMLRRGIAPITLEVLALAY